MARERMMIGTAGEIHTSKRGDTWRSRARFRDYDGVIRQVEALAGTKGLSRTRLKKKIATRQLKTGGEINGQTTVAALAQFWLDEIRAGAGRKPQTIQQYEQAIDKHCIPELGAISLEEARVSLLDRVIKTKAATAPAQARMLRVVLRQMFDLAVRHDAVAANPADKTAPVASTPPRPVALRVSDIADLRRAVRIWRSNTDRTIVGPRPNPAFAVAVDIMIGTGMRISEVMALRWMDVDLSVAGAETLTVAGSMTTLNGQGLVRQDRPKTESGYRQLSLPRFVVEGLRSIYSPEADPASPVCRSRAGTHMSPANFRRTLRSVLRDEGLDEHRIHPHKLRSTAATLIASDGGGIENAAAVLGHSGTEVTRRHYVERLLKAPNVNDVFQTLVEASGQDQAA